MGEIKIATQPLPEFFISLHESGPLSVLSVLQRNLLEEDSDEEEDFFL